MPTAARLIRGILALSVSNVVSWVGAALLALLIPRYLGDVDLGKLTFVGTLVNVIGLVADLGGATYLTKAVSRDPARAGALTITALVTRLPLILVAVIAIVATVHLSKHDPVRSRLPLSSACTSCLLRYPSPCRLPYRASTR